MTVLGLWASSDTRWSASGNPHTRSSVRGHEASRILPVLDVRMNSFGCITTWMLSYGCHTNREGVRGGGGREREEEERGERRRRERRRGDEREGSLYECS